MDSGANPLMATPNGSLLAGQIVCANSSAILTNCTPGIPVVQQLSGTGFTVANSNRASLQVLSTAGAITATLPAPSTLANNYFSDFYNVNTGLATFVSSGGTFIEPGNATSQLVPDGWFSILYNDGTNYWLPTMPTSLAFANANCAGSTTCALAYNGTTGSFYTVANGTGFPLTVSGGVSGGIPYFSSTTTEASSAMLTNGAVVLAANPARKLPQDIPSDESADAAEVAMPTPEEVVKTFAELQTTYQALLATAAVTGFRRAELLGLSWDDVDWLNGSIRIRQTLQRIPKKLLSGGEFRKVERIGETGLAMVTPKSKKARRSVELPPKLAELLVALRNRQKASESTFVFQNEIGTPIDPDSVYDVLHTAQDTAGARRFGLHGLRHLYSSLLVANKVDVKFAQARLGHASAVTTLNIYSHEITKHGREYAAAIEAAFPFVSNLLAEGQIAVATQQNVN
jgi:integrase